MPTKQETFNIVATHLLTQGEKSQEISIDEDGFENPSCKYRGPDGLMCAAGVLIPDDQYTPDMEGLSCSAEDKPIYHVLVQAGHDPNLCQRLQTCHDVYDVEEWPDQLAKIAMEFCLDFTKPS